MPASLLSFKHLLRRQILNLDGLACRLLVALPFWQRKPRPRVVFVTQYYEPSSCSRFAEIRDCILHNVSQDWIDTTVLVCDPGAIPDLDFGARHVVLVTSPARPGFYDLIRSAIRASVDINTVIVMANSDIFLSRAVSDILPYIKDDDFVALTRYESADSQRPYMQATTALGEVSRSQDVWIFKAGLVKNELLESIHDLPVGMLGCENILVNYFLEHGATVSNPCVNIRVVHNHHSRIRSYTKQQRLPGIYSFPLTQSKEQFILGRRFKTVQLNAHDIETV
jgi:hypothetical protein